MAETRSALAPQGRWGPRSRTAVPGDATGTRAAEGRAAKSKDDILQAAFELMRDLGVRRMTIEAVAETAGVGKTTVYRWWRSKGLLALEAWEHGVGIREPAKLPSTGSLRGDLVEITRPVVASIGTVAARMVREIVAEAQSDPLLAAQVFDHVVGPYRETLQPIFDAAALRGEISPTVDVAVLLDALYGAYFHRSLLHHGNIDEAFFVSLVELLVFGASSSDNPT